MKILFPESQVEIELHGSELYDNATMVPNPITYRETIPKPVQDFIRYFIRCLQ